MLISSQKYFKRLVSENIGNKYAEEIGDFIKDGTVNPTVAINLYNDSLLSNDTVAFYKFLISKLHKVIKELLSDEPKTVCQCIKIVTCLITQATITLEKQFENKSLEDVNEFIECVDLKSLSNALTIYFTTGDITEIERQLQRVKDDVIFVKDNFCSNN